MLKKLSASTMLASALVLSVPMAANAFEITLSGDSEFKYQTWSDEMDNTGGQNDSKTSNESHIIIAAENTADNGLTYGAWFRIEAEGLGANGDDNLKEDGHNLYVKGDFGKVQLGSNGSAGGTYYSDVMDTVINDESTSGDGLPAYGYRTDANTSDEVMSYHTPTLGGFKGGISFVDAGADSKADGREIGLQYTGQLMNGSFTLKYASSEYDSNAVSKAAVDANTTTDGTPNTIGSEPVTPSNEVSAASIGGDLKIGAFGLHVSRNTEDKEDANGNKTSELENTGFAGSYQASDALKLALGIASAEDETKDSEVNLTAFSADYTIAKGLKTGLSYTSWDGKKNATDDQDGTYTVVYMKVSF